MSANKTAMKGNRADLYVKSPRNNYASQQTLTDRDVEAKLTQKIYKLKSALKAAERHNEELHNKLKLYRAQSNEHIPALHEEIKSQKRRLESLQMEHQQQISKLKMRKQQEMRTFSAGKITNDSRLRDFEIEIKSKDMKIVQLQGIIKDLNQKIEGKQSQIGELMKRLEAFKVGKDSDETRRVSKLQDQLQAKVVESHEHNRQNLRLKESLKDSIKKIQKANSLAYEQTQKNKQLQEEVKELRKLIDSLQKQNISIRETSDRLKTEALQKLNVVRKLEKCIMESEFKLKRQSERYSELFLEQEKLQEQFKSLLAQFQSTSAKYQEAITSNYELQRDFERELHTIVKELTRRHIVSKSLVNNMAVTRNYGSMGREQDTHQHELP